MKKVLLFAAVVMCCLVSCKNNKNNQPTPEEVEGIKAALADSVLAQIDAFAQEYQNADAPILANLQLTDKEKLVKPDYLLDPAEADKFVTKSQKVNALAFYLIDRGVRVAFDMPLEECDAAISKLAVDLNYPIDVEMVKDENIPVSEKLVKEYDLCKERGDVAYFWQFQYAFQCELAYIFAKDADLFFSKMAPEQVAEGDKQMMAMLNAIKYLSAYDDEMNQIFVAEASRYNGMSPEEIAACYSSADAIKETLKTNRFKTIEWRDALLK